MVNVGVAIVAWERFGVVGIAAAGALTAIAQVSVVAFLAADPLPARRLGHPLCRRRNRTSWRPAPSARGPREGTAALTRPTSRSSAVATARAP